MGAAVGDVTKALDQPGVLAPGIRYELGGLYQQQQIAFNGLIKVFGAALVAELVLLLVLYRRFWLPSSSSAARCCRPRQFHRLWLAGVDLNITALMGMTMIIGIGTEMAIFYVSEFEELATHAARVAARGEPQPPAPDHDDDACGDFDVAATGARDRSGLGHSATTRNRDHRRPVAAVSARTLGNADPRSADPTHSDHDPAIPEQEPAR
jgi:hypothetical protein